MAKVIDELLIGISIDEDERSFREAQGGFDQIKSSAMALGAVIAGGLSLDAIIGKTNELAAEWDGLAKETMALELDPMLVQNLQHISESLGGAKEDAVGLLLNLRSVQQGLKIGDLGYLEELTKITGVDAVSLFQDGDEEDALKRLIGLFGEMNTANRQAAFDVMGLTTGTRNLLQGSVDNYDELIKRSEYLGNITTENTTKAERLQQAYTDAAKSSDAAWQDFYGSLMTGAAESLEYITERLVDIRDIPDQESGFRNFQRSGGETLSTITSDVTGWIFDKIAPEDWRTNPMWSKDALESQPKGYFKPSQLDNTPASQSTSSMKSSTTNYNTININGGNPAEVRKVVEQVISGQANQSEQDLKVNSQ